MKDNFLVVAVALPVPLGTLFDYRWPESCLQPPEAGVRVEVSFGRKKLVGVVLEVKSRSDVDSNRLKPVEACLDRAPWVSQSDLALARWVVAYYQAAPGEILTLLFPPLLRKGGQALPQPEPRWKLILLSDKQFVEAGGNALSASLVASIQPQTSKDQTQLEHAQQNQVRVQQGQTQLEQTRPEQTRPEQVQLEPAQLKPTRPDQAQASSALSLNVAQSLARSPMQAAVLEIIQAAIQPLTLSEISSRLGQRARPFLNALQEKGWVECIEAGVSVEAEVGSEKSSEPVETEAGSEKSSVSVETKADSEKSSEPVETEAGCHESIGPGGEEANGRQTYHAEGGDIAVPLRRLKASNFPLNAEQQQAVEAICRQFDQFCPFLLDGVTGSGKTEVYLVAVRELLERGQQALILVPEIGLTPQLIQRFTDALGYSPVCYHSDMRERERLQVWLACQQGETKVVIGTRSALFLPLPNLKLIVVDEEHDLSYKQQDGVRYSARDVAVRRAQMEGIPVVLGSATPSLESLANVQRGRYKRLRLNHRALTEVFPKVRKIDLRGRKLDHGLTSELISAIDVHVKAGQQVMLFLNRRGFAPVLYCPECGWIAMCPRCDSKYTLHHRAQRLRCHQCGVEKPLPVFCPVCASSDLVPLGKGTERVELALKAHFPDQTVVRIDRDSARSLDQFNQLMHLAQSGEAQILLGTQMVAKGHHLPNVTLAAVIDMDSALFSLDFRAFERCAQMITQVFGRSGRAESPGEVLIQTSQPDHPLLNLLLEKGYRKVAEQLLLERQQADLPPFSYQVVIRAEAQSAELAEQFLTIFAKAVASPDWGVMGPVPAVQARRAGFYRSVLLIQGKSRAELARGVARATQTVKGEAVSRKVRWHVDVDPVEVG